MASHTVKYLYISISQIAFCDIHGIYKILWSPYLAITVWFECMLSSAMWLSLFWVIVDHKYVFSRRIEENDLSLTAFVAGLSKSNFSTFITSEIDERATDENDCKATTISSIEVAEFSSVICLNNKSWHSRRSLLISSGYFDLSKARFDWVGSSESISCSSISNWFPPGWSSRCWIVWMTVSTAWKYTDR